MLSRLAQIARRPAAPRLLAARALAADAGATGASFRDSYGLWINGEEVHTADTFGVEDPATGRELCRVSTASAADVDRAVATARDTFESGVWSRASATERYRVLHSIAALMRERLMSEYAPKETAMTGRAIREYQAQLGRLPEWFEYFGAVARTHEGSVPPFLGNYVNIVRRVPIGVAAIVSPWNHPMLIAVKKIAPALAAGNSVVVKPSELAPVTVLDLCRLCEEAGLPAGVLNCVPGAADTGRALVENPRIAKVDLTGGTPTGREVAAAAGRNLVGCITELGGKAPMLVFEDADVDAVVNGAAFASFIASGQTCIMGARLLVHESIFDEVVGRFAAKAGNIRLGDPFEQGTQMGPVVSGPQLERVEAFVEQAKAEGARVLTGGRRPDGLPAPFDQGYYYEPTVIGDVTPDMRIVQEEVFGPVVVAYSFKDEAEAVELANDSPYGLAAAVWTRDVARAHRVAEQLDVGICWVNDHHRNDPSSPWGGMKDSGMGRENGVEAYLEYTESKSLVVNMSDEPFDWFVEEKVRYS